MVLVALIFADCGSVGTDTASSMVVPRQFCSAPAMCLKMVSGVEILNTAVGGLSVDLVS
jgi:hypothetical protein